MATHKLPVARKKPVLQKKQAIETTQTALSDMKASNVNYFFSKYLISKEITEDCEVYGAVKELGNAEDHDYIRIQPYNYDDDGNKICFEDVFINLKEVNSPTSAAGQFLKLFKKARHWGDILNRVVGLEIKVTEGKPVEGKGTKVFKNVVRVFKTEEDSLVFDDAHATYPKMTKKTSEGKSIKGILDEPDDDLEDTEDIVEEDDAETDTSTKSQFKDDIFDGEDVDDEEDWEDEE